MADARTPEVELTVDGRRHLGWKEARVMRSLERAAGSFDLRLSDRWAPGDPVTAIAPGAPCSLAVDGEPVLTGFVDQVRPSVGPDSHEISVSGRDAAGDLVDCAPDWDPGEWSQRALPELVAALAAPFGIGVRVETDTGAPIPVFRAEQGETAWEAIERACRLRGVLCASDGLGGLLLLRPPGARAEAGLALGDNLLSASGVYQATERFSHYIVKAQQPSSDFLEEEDAATVIAVAEDPGVRRFRPFLRISEGPADTAAAQARVDWEAEVRAARARRAVLGVQGWRQRGTAGALWAPNQLVSVTVPGLGLDGRQLVVIEVEYARGPRGTTSRLTCMDAAAFRPEPKRPKRGDDNDSLEEHWLQ